MKETSVEVAVNSDNGKIARSQKLVKSRIKMRVYVLLSMGGKLYKWERRKTRLVPLQGKISGKGRRPLMAEAPARLTVLTPQSRRQENHPLALTVIDWGTERARTTF